MIGWHFLRDSGRLRDGRQAPPDGEWLEHKGPLIPGFMGLHMSESVMDALQWAPGSLLCRVELEGSLVSHGNPIDKWVGRRRKILARVDASHMLRRFAADQALSVAHLWEMPDVVREYLTTLDESLRASAREAARAARAAERSWEREAAWDAAWDAARDAARAAARAAERSWEAARAALENRAKQLFDGA